MNKLVVCKNCNSVNEIITDENFKVIRGLNKVTYERVYRRNCANCGNLKFASVKPMEGLQ